MASIAEIFATIQADVKERSKLAVQEASEAIADDLRELVNYDCPVFEGEEAGGGAGHKPGADHAEHSPVGGAPFRESGAGYNSIGTANTDDGAKVGVSDTENWHGKSPGNQLAYWDQNKEHPRPWLIPVWQTKHKPNFDAYFTTKMK